MLKTTLKQRIRYSVMLLMVRHNHIFLQIRRFHSVCDSVRLMHFDDTFVIDKVVIIARICWTRRIFYLRCSKNPRQWAKMCNGFSHVLNNVISRGPFASYVKLRVAHAPGMPGTFSPLPRVSNPVMHHGTCVTHVPWCMPGSLSSGFLWIRRREKRSRHSRHMHNP